MCDWVLDIPSLHWLFSHYISKNFMFLKFSNFYQGTFEVLKNGEHAKFWGFFPFVTVGGRNVLILLFLV